MSRSLRELYESSPFSSAQAPFLEAQYERWLQNPADVEPDWRKFFEQVGGGPETPRRVPRPLAGRPTAIGEAVDGEKQAAVSRLIQFFAHRGHLIADIDPLGLMQRPTPRVLEPAYVGLSEADMDQQFHTGSRTAGVEKQMTLREI